MYDLETIKQMNKPSTGGAETTWARVYDLGNGRFALGFRNRKALTVLARKLTKGRGRPRYIGVRGRRPLIGPTATCIVPSTQLRTALANAL